MNDEFKVRIEAEYLIVPAVVVPCANCGKPIEFQMQSDSTWAILPHYYCDKPSATMTTHNPKRLGVVTNVGPSEGGDPPQEIKS